jgi:dienelactone hydrolase
MVGFLSPFLILSIPGDPTAEQAKRRVDTLANMQKVMGKLPDDSAKVPLDVHYSVETRTPHFIRKRLSYAVAKGDRVPAYLLIPLKRQGKLPAVLCLHQTVAIGSGEPAGLGQRENLRYAVHLAERGYVTLAPDYPSFGTYRYDFKKSEIQSGSMKAIWNNMRAIDLLQSLAEVDHDRIGCIGHSLGGHNAIFTAAFDTRIKAVVSNCGFTSFPKYYGGNLKGWTRDRYMPLIASKFGSDPNKVPFDFPEVLAAIAPRSFLAIAPLHDNNFEVSGVKDCIATARAAYESLKAINRLDAYYPDCGHDFPAESRRRAYAWLDRWLEGKEKVR